MSQVSLFNLCWLKLNETAPLLGLMLIEVVGGRVLRYNTARLGKADLNIKNLEKRCQQLSNLRGDKLSFVNELSASFLISFLKS